MVYSTCNCDWRELGLNELSTPWFFWFLRVCFGKFLCSVKIIRRTKYRLIYCQERRWSFEIYVLLSFFNSYGCRCWSTLRVTVHINIILGDEYFYHIFNNRDVTIWASKPVYFCFIRRQPYHVYHNITAEYRKRRIFYRFAPLFEPTMLMSYFDILYKVKCTVFPDDRIYCSN